MNSFKTILMNLFVILICFGFENLSSIHCPSLTNNESEVR